MAALPEGMSFEPLMTLYLTEDTDPADVVRAHAEGIVTAVKLYPAGATPNSASGVRDFDKVRPVLEAMADGWRIIKFPEMVLAMDDQSNYGLGYEFILERWR